ncbi:MAG: AAA family ATPase, partial [Thermoplasmata archaeon]|nr:AAA family ATPase [Thermoplasmata archaeon]
KKRKAGKSKPGLKSAPASKKRTAHGRKAKSGKQRVDTEKHEFIKTGMPGLDDLFERGIPKNSGVIIAGGAGSGKTLLCLQMLVNAAKDGKKCMYLSFEESAERLRGHMQKFGWDLGKHEGNLIIKRLDLFDITRSIEALLAKQSGDLLIDVSPVIIPEDFKPDMVVIDSLTAIASAFTEMKGAYRIYIEQLFRYFERMGVNTFLISETEEDPTVYSPTGVEEFLADGVIVLYNIRKGNVRENGIEVLKMRGAKHKKKIVAMQITDKKGIEVYPEQEVFSI